MNDEVRAVNRKLARRLGYPAPPDDVPFPAVDGWRPVREVADRTLVLNVVVSCAHGLEPGKGWTWLTSAGLAEAVTPAEREYLDELESGMHIDDLARRLQVEALWALLWALSFTDALDFGEGCGGRVAPLLPSLEEKGGSALFRREAELRDEDDLVATLDLARCEVEPYVVFERRRALEWLAGAAWD